MGRTAWFGRILSALLLVVGLVLMAVNIYGLTQPLRKPGLGINDHENLRFVPEQVRGYRASMAELESLDRYESAKERAERANVLVNKSLVHIKWLEVDPVEYRQLVPIWENYFLWVVGKFSGLPQFQRYHYADYQRSIERGIGICGDASTVLSSVLDRYGIENEIVSFRGHVIVKFQDQEGRSQLLDPDFGVVLNQSLESLKKKPDQVRDVYLAAGYSPTEIDDLLMGTKVSEHHL